MEKPKSTKELARSLGLLRRKSKSCGQGTKHINRSGQPFQYIAVIDFESTCWKDQKFRTQEIIEFPAVLLNTSTGECESEFHYYVQPSEEPTLSDFCRQLTGITQAQVEDGIPLSLCLKKFCHWVEKLGREKNVQFNPTSDHTVKGTFLTWSDWDLSVCLQYECKRKQILKPVYLNSWIDLRAVYRKFYDRKPQGLNGALQDLGIQFSGREHSGVDDARNTAQLAWRMIRDGCILNVTKSMKETVTDCNLTVKQTPLAVSPKSTQLNQLFKLPLSPAPRFHNPKQGMSTDDQSSPVGKQSKCVKMSKLPIQTNKTRPTELFKRPLSPAVNRGRPSRRVATGSPLSKQAKLTACTSPQVSNAGIMAQRTSTAQIFQRQDLIFSDEVSSNTTIMRQSAVSGCNKPGLQSVSVNSWLGSRPVTANNKKPSKQVERFQDKENVVSCLSSTSTISSKSSAFKTPSPPFSRVSSLVQRKLGMVTPGLRPAQTPVSVGGATPPLCQCGKRSKRRFVQSPGPNQGRCFFSCPQGRRPSMVAPGKHTGCQFFKWESSLSGRPKQSADVPHRSTMSTGHLRKAVSRTAGCLNRGHQTDSRIQKRPSSVFLR